jgi:hypothetical protein
MILFPTYLVRFFHIISHPEKNQEHLKHISGCESYPLVNIQIAIEKLPFIVNFPIKKEDFP